MQKFLLTFLILMFSSPSFAGDGITTTISGNTVTLFATLSGKGQAGELYHGCVNVYGTFSSGTISWQVSTDDGTTKIALKDLTGTAATSTVDDNFCFNWGFPSAMGDQTLFYASMAGAGTPSVTIDLFDNR